MAQSLQSDVVIAGGGLAGIVTALELLRKGKSVTIIDRDTDARFGGLARWAFGGMALVGTPQQKRANIPDNPDTAYKDWLSFGELAEDDVVSRQWARYYVENSRSLIYDWLVGEGLKFLPAVNWAERGRFSDGNTYPRYHIVWGTSQEMIKRLIVALHEADNGKLTLLHQHSVLSLDHEAGRVTGVQVVNDASQETLTVKGETVVLAMGGINGSPQECRANWPAHRPMPTTMLNGAHPYADGKLHHWVEDNLQGTIHNAGEMWNYAAGIPHPQPHFEGHGLSLIPCKSALWLDHQGNRIGPEPLVTGFDTHWLCQRIAQQKKPWSWQVMNWSVAAKEFAISGAEHNARVREKQFFRFVFEMLTSNDGLVRQMQAECPQFLVDDSLQGLVQKMNALTGESYVNPSVLQQTLDRYDANFQKGSQLENDDQIRLIRHCRQWGPDKLRTHKPAPIQGKGPFIAIQTQLISRKSLGGLRTDLQSRVLDGQDQPIEGLYCVGEAAGFGGGGANGKRSLEGTFLPGCILTARVAARSILGG